MPLGLLFSGQGAQKVGMGRSFYDNSPVARELYDRADEVLGWSLTGYSFDGPEEALTETRHCQPALYVMGYAIAEILRRRGKLDDVGAVLGLSLGELTACAVAEVFDFETGLRVVAERGRLMQEACEQSEGAMASVIMMDRPDVQKLCDDYGIQMANLLAPGNIAVSGEKEKVAAALGVAKERGAKMAMPLNVAGAYHSRLMEPARVEFEKFLRNVAFNAPGIPLFSNTTGGRIEAPEQIREALVKQVVSSVLWEDCVRAAAALGVSEFYECGPGGVLAGLARRTDRSWSVTKVEQYEDLPA